MGRSTVFLAMLVLVSFGATASAAPIVFHATGSPDVSGFVTFDDSAFSGIGNVSNSNILALSLTVGGVTFGFGDVVVADDTRIDDTGALPRIANGAGALAFNGAETIAFFPDGWNGTTPDGDASLLMDTDGDFNFSGAGWEHSYAVRWDPNPVPEPSQHGHADRGESRGSGDEFREGMVRCPLKNLA